MQLTKRRKKKTAPEKADEEERVVRLDPPAPPRKAVDVKEAAKTWLRDIARR